jgi:hypothetical protein
MSVQTTPEPVDMPEHRIDDPGHVSGLRTVRASTHRSEAEDVVYDHGLNSHDLSSKPQAVDTTPDPAEKRPYALCASPS